MIDQNLRILEGVGEVDTEIVWNSVWTPERMSASARQKLTLPMAQLLPLRQQRLEREAREAQASHMADLRVVQDVGMRTLQPHTPALQHDSVRGEAQARTCVLLDQHNRSATAL